MRYQAGDFISYTWEGKKIDFKVLTYIGSGAYGSVFQVLNLENNRKFALKVLEHGENYSERLSRFKKEGEILSKLNHPNIVRLEYTHLEKEPLWYAMELLTGPSLQSLMGKDIPRYKKIWLLQQIADAVGYMHDLGYQHRDIKPDNIKLRSEQDETPVLFDMGLVRDPWQRQTLGYQIPGTLIYLAPEQLQRCHDCKESDIWSLGMILYQMLTGIHPLCVKDDNNDSMAIIRRIEEKTIPRLREYTSDIDDYLQEVCDCALNRDITRRYATGRLFAAALNSWRNENRKRCELKANAREKEGDWQGAIELLEQAHVWCASEEMHRRLPGLWQRYLVNTDIRLCSEEQWGKRPNGNNLKEIEIRHCKNEHVTHCIHTYVVYQPEKSNDLPPKELDRDRDFEQGTNIEIGQDRANTPMRLIPSAPSEGNTEHSLAQKIKAWQIRHTLEKDFVPMLEDMAASPNEWNMYASSEEFEHVLTAQKSEKGKKLWFIAKAMILVFVVATGIIWFVVAHEILNIRMDILEKEQQFMGDVIQEQRLESDRLEKEQQRQKTNRLLNAVQEEDRIVKNAEDRIVKNAEDRIVKNAVQEEDRIVRKQKIDKEERNKKRGNSIRRTPGSEEERVLPPEDSQLISKIKTLYKRWENRMHSWPGSAEEEQALQQVLRKIDEYHEYQRKTGKPPEEQIEIWKAQLEARVKEIQEQKKLKRRQF